MRIVLDTNVLVSGLISRTGYPGRLLRAVQSGRVTLITSEYQIAELRDVLFRDSLRRFIQPAEATDLIHHMATVAVVIDELPEVGLSPDPKDNAILATGIAGQADLIVSGDKNDVVALGDAEGIPIVTPREGFERLAHLMA